MNSILRWIILIWIFLESSGLILLSLTPVTFEVYTQHFRAVFPLLMFIVGFVAVQRLYVKKYDFAGFFGVLFVLLCDVLNNSMKFHPDYYSWAPEGYALQRMTSAKIAIAISVTMALYVLYKLLVTKTFDTRFIHKNHAFYKGVFIALTVLLLIESFFVAYSLLR